MLIRSLGRTLTCLPVALADGQGVGEAGGMAKVFSQASGRAAPAHGTSVVT